MPWNPEETLSRPEMAKLQTERLQKVCERVYARVPFYKKKFDEKGIKPSDIKSIQDVVKLPFTKKSDLRDNYPYGLFAEPLDDIVRIHASSGTTGKPTVVAYNRNDINLWAEVMARTFTCAGVTNKDVVQNAYGYGLFTGGLGAHYGAERVGAAVIPISGGNTQKQIMLLQDFGSTVLTCTPSFALYIYDVACEMKINLDTIKLRVGLFGAEPWTEEMRQEIEERLRIKAIDIYGLSEIIGPGVSSECVEAQNGLHLNEDHFYPEIINPATGEQLPYGQEGELVITSMSREAMPLIRYRTGDITSLNPEKCNCGRTHGPHAARAGTGRRYADHPRGERVPVAGRVGAAPLRGGGAALHHRSEPQGPDGRDERARRSDAQVHGEDGEQGALHGPEGLCAGRGRADPSQARDPEEREGHHRREYRSDPPSAEHDPAERRQGQAGDRQQAEVDR